MNWLTTRSHTSWRGHASFLAQVGRMPVAAVGDDAQLPGPRDAEHPRSHSAGRDAPRHRSTWVAVLRLLLLLHVLPARGWAAAGSVPSAMGIWAGRPCVVGCLGPDRTRPGVHRTADLPAPPGSGGVAELACSVADRGPRPAARGSLPGKWNLHERDQHRRPDRSGVDSGTVGGRGLEVDLRHRGIAWFSVVGGVATVHPPS